MAKAGLALGNQADNVQPIIKVNKQVKPANYLQWMKVSECCKNGRCIINFLRQAVRLRAALGGYAGYIAEIDEILVVMSIEALMH